MINDIWGGGKRRRRRRGHKSNQPSTAFSPLGFRWARPFLRSFVDGGGQGSFFLSQRSFYSSARQNPKTLGDVFCSKFDPKMARILLVYTFLRRNFHVGGRYQFSHIPNNIHTLQMTIEKKTLYLSFTWRRGRRRRVTEKN